MAKESRLSYQNYVPAVPLDSNYPLGQNRRLIETEGQLDALISAVSKQHFYAVGLDTETNDLSPEHGELVGISIAFTRTDSVYLPVGHKTGKNLPFDKVIYLAALMFKVSERVCFWNFRFDFRFLRASGIKKHLDSLNLDINNLNYFDAQVLAYNADTNISMKDLSLKKCALHHMGWRMRTFKETTEENDDFSYNHPEECYEYACDDALATLGLVYVLSWVYKECKFICDLDNAVLMPVLEMEDTPTILDKKWLEGMGDTITSEMAEIEAKVYQHVGYSFKINSSQQLVKALDSLGLHTNRKTDKGASSTKEEALEEIKDKHEVISLIIEYKKLLKMKSSYVESLILSYREDLGGCRFSYMTVAVPTGRFASGGGGKNSKKRNRYYGMINVQCLSLDSPVPTDKGLVKMGDLDSHLRVWDGESFSHFEGPFYKTCPGLKVTSELGNSLVCGYKHKWYSDKGWVKAEDLTEGSWISVNIKNIPNEDTTGISKEMCFLAGSKIGKELPDWVFSLSSDGRRALIKSLMLADGDLSEGLCRFKTSSESLARGFQLLLFMEGFISGISRKPESWEVLIWNSEDFFEEAGSIFEKGRLAEEVQERVGRLPDLVANRLSGRVSKISKTKEFYIQEGLEDLALKVGWVKVSKIEKVGEVEMADIYVPGTERFVAGGFIVHNSTPKSSTRNYNAVKGNGPESILGWVFKPDDNGPYEGFVQRNNIRTAFGCPEGYLWVSLDYSGQELRIPTNLCVSLRSRVETNISVITMRSVKGFIEAGRTVLVKTLFGMRKVLRFFDRGLQEKVIVTMEDGTEEVVSPNHKYLVRSLDGLEFLPVKYIDVDKHEIVDSSMSISEEEYEAALRRDAEDV